MSPPDGQNALRSPARIERIFETLRSFRQWAQTAESDSAVYARVCELAVAQGGFCFAWVGELCEDGQIVVLAHAGEGAASLEHLRGVTITSDKGEGPTGRALREGRPVICTDLATAAGMAPWRHVTEAFGFRAAAAFPIFRNGKVTNSFTLYAPTVGFEDPLERAMASALADELGSALTALARSTAQRTAETALRASEERWREILEIATDGIFLAGPDHRYLEVNRAGCAMLGYTRDELLGMHIEDLIAPESLAAAPVDPSRFQDGRSILTERTLMCKDGHHIDVEIHGTRLDDGRLQSVVRDISERKRVHAERAANERMFSLGRLAHSIGHEINNPLLYMSLSLDHAKTLLAKMPEPQASEVLAEIDAAVDGANRITHVVRALSAFGRGDTETITSVDVQRAVNAAMTLTSNRAQHIACVTATFEPALYARANEFGLTQVLVNLLLNAADAMEQHPGPHTLELSTRRGALDRVLIEVRDNGPGVSRDLLERVFDPFFTTKAIGKGTGLGLFIARGIVTSFGASLEASNNAAGGATFTISLDPWAAAVAAPGPVVQREATPRSVLVVDDEAMVARGIASSLRGCAVVVCNDVASALTACANGPFDCIFCDLMMPGKGGMEFYEELRTTAPALLPRVVFMTGGAFTSAATAFLERVPNPTLLKPFTRSTLIDTLEQVCRS